MATKTRTRRKTTKKTRKAAPRAAWYEGFEHRYALIKKEVKRAATNKNGGKKGWTIDLLAEWCGVSHTALNNMANDITRDPRLSTIDRIGIGLGIGGVTFKGLLK